MCKDNVSFMRIPCENDHIDVSILGKYLSAFDLVLNDVFAALIARQAWDRIIDLTLIQQEQSKFVK